ncbi:MAG TPA: NAD-dependent epimerase/dehydratase family protein, partial [Chloroflexota bacterium]|nr:NAD-dependent epimerase/dehydratase family protein [Chloroflexota bacterium]
MKLVLAGGTGQIGQLLVRELGRHGHQIIVLSRSGSGDGQVVPWDGRILGAWAAALDGADAVINLAGRITSNRMDGRTGRILPAHGDRVGAEKPACHPGATGGRGLL